MNVIWIKKFAWFPMKIEHHVIWLEHYWQKQIEVNNKIITLNVLSNYYENI